MFRVSQIILLALVATTLCVDGLTLRQDRRHGTVTVRLIAMARGSVRRRLSRYRLLARRGLAAKPRRLLRPQVRWTTLAQAMTAPLLRLPPPSLA